MIGQSYKEHIAFIISLLWLSLGLPPPAEARNFDPDASDTAFDLSALQREGSKRFPELTPKQIRALTQHSFESVYFSKVARDRLLVRPSPELIRKQIDSLLETFNDLSAAVHEGTAVIVDEGSVDDRLLIIHRIQTDAAKIHKIFTQYFREPHRSSLTIRFPVAPDSLGQFVLFLHSARKLLPPLSAEITDYFFDHGSGVLRVVEIDNPYTISAITDVIVQMCEEVTKRPPYSG